MTVQIAPTYARIGSGVGGEVSVMCVSLDAVGDEPEAGRTKHSDQRSADQHVGAGSVLGLRRLGFALMHEEGHLGVDAVAVDLAVLDECPVVVDVNVADVIHRLGSVLVGVFGCFFDGVSFGEDFNSLGD